MPPPLLFGQLEYLRLAVSTFLALFSFPLWEFTSFPKAPPFALANRL